MRSIASGSISISGFFGLFAMNNDRVVSVTNLASHPDIAKALGEMVVAWANVDCTLVLALSHAAKMDANLALTAYYRIPTFEARTKTIIAILADSDCRLLNREAVAKAVSKLAKLASARNNWIHGSYFTDGTKIINFDYRRPIGHESRTRTLKAHDIMDHVSAVHRRTIDLNRLLPTAVYLA